MNDLLKEPNKWISHDEVAEYSHHKAKTEAINDLVSTLHTSDISGDGHGEGPVKASQDGKQIGAPSIENVISCIAIGNWDAMEQV